ncbi:PX domain-containing protein EREX [Zea mays]|uniref:PX domain-containing protein EREX n=1 Tax=Zea mays TaxID=4577 RepID=A0A3L6DFD2_MAIZE|nr:phox (PX) domain-containing protein isoform X1 [Zea mays]PWZ07305.1 PX domain-containing protein EREX [Zea mays]|eukprot:XP_008658867.1 phox (PX) domain-containing protein isoform X1 [Zea mays]
MGSLLIDCIQEGRNTIWPHNPQTGWSYCVMMPSWITQTPETGVTADSFLKSVVFYRIHVGIQSSEGFSSIHGILRRFSDFLKLSSDLKSAFPRKDVPSAPPKHAFLRINSSRLLLEERRHALEEWMQKLLSDIDLSRSAPVAAFLELEAAARSYFQERNGRPSEVGPSAKSSTKSSSHSDGPASGSLAESNEINQGLTRGSSLTGATGNGVLGEAILDQSDEHVSSALNHRKGNLVLEHDGRNGSVASYRGVLSEEDRDSYPGHARKDSAESIGSDLSSLRGSELSVPGASNSLWDGAVVDGHVSQTEHLTGLDMHLLYDMDAQVILPNDKKQKLTRLLITMQRRIGTAKTDMEDLIARLNQEGAVKEYLTTKVKDLEVELEATKQKGRETLQQAILAERERITQMQWDMDELRRKYSEMESNLKTEHNEKTRAESERTTASGENETLLEELEIKQKEVESLKQQLVEAEAKSKADKKVLVKEVKSLRNSQTEMKKVLNQYLEEKTDLERVINRDKQRSARTKLSRVKILHECRLLRERLQDCSAKFLAEEQDNFTIDPSSLPDALDLLATSDNRIRLLVAEAQLLARDDEQGSSDGGDDSDSRSSLTMSSEDAKVTDEDTTKMLSDLLIDNAQLRLRLNAVIRNAVNTSVKPEKEGSGEVLPKKTVLNWLLDR